MRALWTLLGMQSMRESLFHCTIFHCCDGGATAGCRKIQVVEIRLVRTHCQRIDVNKLHLLGSRHRQQNTF